MKEAKNNEGYKKLSTKMHKGTTLREIYRKDIFASYGLAKLYEIRRTLIKAKKANTKIIYLIDSLKHPEELKLLRETYGNSFFLIAVNSTKNERMINLKQRHGMTEDEAYELIVRDEEEVLNKQYGQRMSKVYEQADVFLKFDTSFNDVYRLVQLIFGNTNISPTRQEFLMQLAASAATFSSDLSRQVGAVLISKNGDVIGIGKNEVPKSGGGQYVEGDIPDGRDFTLKHDPNHKRRLELLDKISEKKKTNKSSQNQNAIREDKIKNLTEFHRSVHAEMEAILSAGRIGQSTLDSVIYCTTFPCHNCAKHIIAAGIKSVYFIEAYPKSLATELHRDSLIQDESDDLNSNKVELKRFYGIGPKRYFDLFSLTLTNGEKIDRKEDENSEEPWSVRLFDIDKCYPRFKLKISHAILKEMIEIDWLILQNSILKSKSKKEFSLLLKTA